MLINYVFVADGEITVGATTQERWGWELADGRETGVDATTLVWVTLLDGGPGMATMESVGLFPVQRGSAERRMALAVIPALLEAAWQIKELSGEASATWRAWLGRTLAA